MDPALVAKGWHTLTLFGLHCPADVFTVDNEGRRAELLLHEGLFAEFAGWIDQIGARIAVVPPEEHDRLCAWVSHLPQMISTALASTLVEEFGEDAPLLTAGGRALQEMTRISASPYSRWRDVAISNKKNLENALCKVEQRLAHIRENLATRQLADEFEQAHQLRKARLKKS